MDAWTLTPIGPGRRTVAGPLLIAAGSDDHPHGALCLAEVLARRDRVNAHVLTVLPPLSASLSTLASLTSDLERRELDECLRDKAQIRTRSRVNKSVGLAWFFTTGAEVGPVSATIAASARARSAAYVLAGLAPAGTEARSSAATTVSRMAMDAAVPVLAVTAEVDHLPDSALVIADFGATGIRAAQAALPLLAEGGCLTWVHLVPAGPASPDGGLVAATPAPDVRRRLADELGEVGDIAVRIATLEGDPLGVLADWVPQFDLIALCTTPRADSAAEEPVTAAVFRHARRGVLIAPPAADSSSSSQEVP